MGERIEERASTLECTAEEGHEIGNHTFSRGPLNYMTDEEMVRELTVTKDMIKKYCEDHGIEMFAVKNKVYNIYRLKNVHTDIDRSKVRFVSRIKLIKLAELVGQNLKN